VGHKVAYDSFARSGNTFLRKLFEQVTGISTGSNFPMIPATMQQMLGMRGEGYIDGRVWIIKSPVVSPGLPLEPYSSNKVIMCVRNPLDVFPSMMQLLGTMSHSAKFEFEVE